MYKPEEAHKLLGVLTDPAGSGSEQVEYVKGQAREWNTRLLHAPIPSSLKKISYTTELIPRLTYPLPAIYLTERECKDIMDNAMPSIKHGFGLARTVETEVMYFPKAYGGYGVLDLHLAQTVEQARYVIQHIRL